MRGEQMNSPLKDFFEHERQHVVSPGPYFSKRVLARLKETRREESEIWDVVPASARPVFALALSLFLGFMAFQMFIPEVPEHGFVETYLDAEQTPGENLLYSEAELPDGQQLFLQMIGVGEEGE